MVGIIYEHNDSKDLRFCVLKKELTPRLSQAFFEKGYQIAYFIYGLERTATLFCNKVGLLLKKEDVIVTTSGRYLTIYELAETEETLCQSITINVPIAKSTLSASTQSVKLINH